MFLTPIQLPRCECVNKTVKEESSCNLGLSETEEKIISDSLLLLHVSVGKTSKSLEIGKIEEFFTETPQITVSTETLFSVPECLHTSQLFQITLEYLAKSIEMFTIFEKPEGTFYLRIDINKKKKRIPIKKEVLDFFSS